VTGVVNLGGVPPLPVEEVAAGEWGQLNNQMGQAQMGQAQIGQAQAVDAQMAEAAR